MKEFNPEQHQSESQTMSAVEALTERVAAGAYAAYVGMDVHKATIAVAVAEPGREEPRFRGQIANNPKAVEKLISALSDHYGGGLLLFCYEAGPCGYVLKRQIVASGLACDVVAPSKIPKCPGDRVKTDRRDALKLARLLRSGELSAVWVPGEEQEAMRDLSRARQDMKGQEHKARQQLNGFVLRHAHHWPSGKSRWTRAHYNWLESLRFNHDGQQVVLQEYIEAVRAASARVAGMASQMKRAAARWSLAPVVDALMALRGVDQVAAITFLAEMGDITRFTHPRQLMAYLGLVPSEHSSGPRRQQGGLTLTGNRHARRLLVECAWNYRFPARHTMHLKRKAKNAPAEAREVAWRAQKRLCGRFSTMVLAGKNPKLVMAAIARELVGFIWDIVRQEMGKLRPAAA
jgi:transposase